MATIEYRKVKCDECGQIVEVEGGGSYPSNWLVIHVTEWFGNSGDVRLDKEFCSEKCVLTFMNELKKIPKKKAFF